MSENIAQTVQKVIQDLVAPEVKELKVLVSALQKQIDQRFEGQNQATKAEFKALDQKTEAHFKALDQKSDMQFQALMAAFGEFKAQSELTSIRIISQLSERVAVLEAQRH
jgi:hypothetical protein